ncbi:MAG: beta-eliminating lyase-related protein [Pseudomonadota bacterium]
MWFASDNVTGAAPEVLEALVKANRGGAAAYGGDLWCASAEARLREAFETDCRIFLVATGTASNALALAAAAPPWGAIFCHKGAHIEDDECGAPEFFTGGAKLVLLEGAHGKIAPDALDFGIRAQGARGVHQAPAAALSLTQATEAGTVYRPEEVAAAAERAHAAGLKVHMDGARFANAVARLGCAPADLSWRAGVDALSLGATKNGAMAAEAILAFDPEIAKSLPHRRKQAGHLFSKLRFVGAQMDAWLTDGLWLRLAGRANAMADRLAAGLAAIPGVRLRHAVEANMMFVDMPQAVHAALKSAGARYYLEPAWGRETDPMVGARLVCSFETTDEEIDRALAIAAEAAAGGPAAAPAPAGAAKGKPKGKAKARAG